MQSLHNSTSCGTVSRRICFSRFTWQRSGTGNLCKVLSLMKYNMAHSFTELQMFPWRFICFFRLTFFAGLDVKIRKFLAHVLTLTRLADDFFLTVFRDTHGDSKNLSTIFANVLIDWHKHLPGFSEKIIIRRSLFSTESKDKFGLIKNQPVMQLRH